MDDGFAAFVKKRNVLAVFCHCNKGHVLLKHDIRPEG